MRLCMYINQIYIYICASIILTSLSLSLSLPSVCTLHYITLHYIALHCITLHYITYTAHIFKYITICWCVFKLYLCILKEHTYTHICKNKCIFTTYIYNIYIYIEKIDR